jgi:NSS family neurotransmitter:Na+ symporter
MITYAAHARPEMNLRKVAILAILGDTAVSFAAGLAIFPIVFVERLDPAAGPGLLFVTLPLAFAKIPGGMYAALGFFVLLVVAGVASGISMLEMPVAALTRRGWGRGVAVAGTAIACWLCGLPTVFSFNIWSSWRPLAAIPAFAEASIFYLLDHLTSNLMLPLGGLALSLFVGWKLPSEFVTQEIGSTIGAAKILQFLLRYVIPLGIGVVALWPLF